MATKQTYKKGDAELRVHKDWLNLLQPVGLVVSPPALKAAQATPNANVVIEQQRLIRLAVPTDESGQSDWVATEQAERACVKHFPTFTVDVLGWREADLVEKPAELCVPVLGHDDTLSPTWAVKAEDGSWLLLIREEAPFGKDLDVVHEVQGQEWEATPQARFERLLRETKVPIGILCNGTQLRLVYAPPGESSGHLTFPVAAMCRSNQDGRLILGALLMLLGSPTLWTKPEKERLPFLLKESRKYQALVTTKLADQVLDGLRELLNGFQSAHVASGGLLLQEMLATRAGRQEIYGGMLASILRCVFVLYAEDRGLMPQDETYLRGYSLTRLFEKLREDAALYPDTMDQRYGAWTQLLALFRLIFDGAEHGPLKMPAREGKLFNPDTYPFLEGRPWRSLRVMGEREKPPRISDGVVYRLLERLLLLDGERLSYRALDVEQIGSVYEALMGFELEVAHGASVALKPKHVVVDLDAVLRVKANEREELLKKAEVKTVPKEVKAAKTLDELLESLDKLRSPRTPSVIPLGAMYLQPGEERRRSGSHYTPRALTEPIVATTLRPIFEQLGPRPRPKDILALKVCDPAMGSGAFLVEACRQLADKVVDAWNQHPLDKPNFKGEEMILRARREVAQRCLYGVDKNPFAVDLAKLSLWLATLAKDHPFTFLDHSLKCGDSLVGLTKEQIVDMAWPNTDGVQLSTTRTFVDEEVKNAADERGGIFALGDSDDVHQKQRHLNDADGALTSVRVIADAVIAAFFAGENDKQRKTMLEVARSRTLQWLDRSASRAGVDELVSNELANDRERESVRFHWEIEFPEVFGKEAGFHCIVGNPPFLGGRKISTAFGDRYLAYLLASHPGAGNLCDIVAHFFRRAFSLLRPGGTLGLIATKTIAQGDTREGGLKPLRNAGGVIFEARKRIPWPGRAAVIVSIVHMSKGPVPGPILLDGKAVSGISAFLIPGSSDDTPLPLGGQADLFSKGSQVYGQGFLFDDEDSKASSLAKMREVLAAEPSLASRIFPYIGGDEINSSPTLAAHRFAIYLSDLKEEIELAQFPLLASIIREKVKPERDALPNNPSNVPLKRRWWAYQAHRPELYRRMKSMTRVLVGSQVTAHLVLAFQPTDRIFSQKLNVFLFEESSAFAVMQSRVHEVFALTFSSTLGDGLNYSASDCFVPYPFPTDFLADQDLGSVADRYLAHRDGLMRSREEGLTKTYNRFHDPDEHDPQILKLRALHDDVDRAVLDAYDWTDIRPTCTFVLDYEEAEDDEDEGGKRKKKKPWRYRWPDDIRDDVLARLMKLNAERYAEEQRMGNDKQLAAAAGAAADDGAGTNSTTKKKATRKKKSDATPGLFDAPAEAGDE